MKRRPASIDMHAKHTKSLGYSSRGWCVGALTWLAQRRKALGSTKERMEMEALAWERVDMT